MAKNKNQEYSNYPFSFGSPVQLDFNLLYKHYFDFIVRDIFQMFIFEHLPETINETFLKYCVFLNGKAVFFELDNGDLVALNGAPSDVPNLYYIPERMLVVNPRLHKSYNLKINEECVVVYCSETDVYNQLQYGGLYSLIAKTATMLADNDLSINVAQKNTRLINILAAEDQQTKDAIDVVIKKQHSGQPYAVVMKSLIDNIQSVPIVDKSNNQYLVQLVELHQYILAHFYEAIGLTVHDNMKKERLITDEIHDNAALANLNIDNMLQTIQNGLDNVNKKYGTEIIIKLNPLLEEPEPESESELPADGEPEQQPDEEPEQQPDEEPEQQPDEEPEQQPDEEPKQQPDAEPEQKIEININVTDEAIADIQITDVGGDSDVSDSTNTETMVGNSGDAEN